MSFAIVFKAQFVQLLNTQACMHTCAALFLTFDFILKTINEESLSINNSVGTTMNDSIEP